MDLREIGVYEKLDSFGSGYGLLEGPCECSVEFLGSISHGVRFFACVCLSGKQCHLNRFLGPVVMNFILHSSVLILCSAGYFYSC